MDRIASNQSASVRRIMATNRQTLSICFAMGTMTCFGVTNWILGYVAEESDDHTEASISGAILVWNGLGLMGILATAFLYFTGRGFKGVPSKKHAAWAAVAGVSLSLGMFTLKLGLGTEPESKGPIVAITACNSIVVSLVSFVYLKERLSALQVVGMVVAVGGVITMASDNSGSGWTAFLWGVATTLCFSFTNSILKIVGHHGLGSIVGAIFLWLAGGGMGLLGLVVTAASGRWMDGLDGVEWRFLPLIAGLSLAVGMLCLKIALALGQAGPATAIGGSSAILVLVLDLIILGHSPPELKIAGMFITLLGVAILSLSHYFEARWFKSDNTERTKDAEKEQEMVSRPL